MRAIALRAPLLEVGVGIRAAIYLAGNNGVPRTYPRNDRGQRRPFGAGDGAERVDRPQPRGRMGVRIRLLHRVEQRVGNVRLGKAIGLYERRYDQQILNGGMLGKFTVGGDSLGEIASFEFREGGLSGSPPPCKTAG
jgi:hypothetical protein